MTFMDQEATSWRNARTGRFLAEVGSGIKLQD